MAENYDTPSEYETKYKKDYKSDWDIHQNYVQTFDAYEAMLIGQVYDAVSGSIDSSKITDSYAATLAKERADRVVAKLPDGQTMPTGKADMGKAAFMDILRQKWIYPNANAQHPFLVKLNMWQLYSSVYGYMPMMYDWNVSSTGYIGPDCWLWSPRNLVPQQGRVSITDMDYVTALTWVSKKYLKDIRDGLSDNKEDRGGWNQEALDLLIEQAEKSTTPDFQKDSKISRERTPQAVKKGICLATRYEAGNKGKWCTFAPDHGFIQVREIKNPHKNGRIPFVVKWSQQLFDSFYGLGDFQRAKPLQFARDGLTNFYFKGIKMNLIPPIIANANGVLKHTLDYREGAVMLETIPNSIRRLETSTAGLATYKDAQSNLTGSLLSLFGSQNASIPGAETLNPSQGKTPAAISLYGDKEATRDGAERRNLEVAIEQLTDGFFSMVAAIGTEDIPITLLADDIEDIRKSGLSDVQGLFTGKLKPDQSMSAADLKIKPSALKGIEYRFNIAPDSTAKINKDAQRTAIENMMDRIGKFQNIFKDDPRVNVNWEAILKEWGALSDIPGANDFITFDEQAQPTPPPPPPPPQPEPPSPTSIQLPSGITIESAEAVKMYLGSENVTLRNQILELLGFAPSETEADVEQTVTGSGHMFKDPHIGAAADALNNLVPQADIPMPSPEEPEPEPEPTVAPSGHSFADPHVGQVASAISKIK